MPEPIPTLHLLDAPDELCLARLRDRNARGRHAFIVSEAEFVAFTRHFAPPTPEEGFHVVAHTSDEGAGRSPGSVKTER